MDDESARLVLLREGGETTVSKHVAAGIMDSEYLSERNPGMRGCRALAM
jgi:hypothetical protein